MAKRRELVGWDRLKVPCPVCGARAGLGCVDFHGLAKQPCRERGARGPAVVQPGPVQRSLFPADGGGPS